MPRRYDASKRRSAAEKTRHDILQAALKLHWEGITDYEALASEAGCSLATVRKHFPNKETLYRNCTRTFAESLVLPDLPALSSIEKPSRRVEQCVSELCRIHEAMFGYAWLGVQQRETSPVLDAEMSAYEGLADGISDMIAPMATEHAALIRGLLDFLSYRALRLSGKLSPDEARLNLTNMIFRLLPDHSAPAA